MIQHKQIFLHFQKQLMKIIQNKLSFDMMSLFSNQITKNSIILLLVIYLLHTFKIFLSSYIIKRSKNIKYSIQRPFFTQNRILLLIGMMGILVNIKIVSNQINQSISVKNNSKTQVHNNQCSFDDYFGGQNIKKKFNEVIQFLKQPETFKIMGARTRRGVLFYGPPGTGKTMLARALANQSKCQFIKATASQFEQIYVGVGAKRIRQLFKMAKQCKKGCIIFIDEIDALGNRTSAQFGSSQSISTITQLLTQMDGFTQNDRIIVVAATNRIDLVDAAILRAGRFDLKVHISLPNQQEREGILKTIISKKNHNNKINNETIKNVASLSQKWCGADFQTLVNESIYKAIKQQRTQIEPKDLIQSFQEMIRKTKHD